MFESAINILNQYLDKPISHFAIKKLSIEPIDVVEFLYLCETKDAAYLVFETDFIFSLPKTAQETENIFRGFTLKGWLVKRVYREKYGAIQPLTTDIEENRELYDALISNEAQLRQAVIRIEKSPSKL